MSGMKGKKRGSVPLWVVDGLVDMTDAARNLSQAVECASVAAQTSITDPMDFIKGALSVLLLAAEDASEQAENLRREAETALGPRK